MELGDASDEEAPPPGQERDAEILMVANDFDAAKHAM